MQKQEKRNHFKNNFKKPDFIPKNVLCEKVPSKRLLQMGESMNNKYKSFNVDEIRENLINITNFFS